LARKTVLSATADYLSNFKASHLDSDQCASTLFTVVRSVIGWVIKAIVCQKGIYSFVEHF